jgi:hypothetical protein
MKLHVLTATWAGGVADSYGCSAMWTSISTLLGNGLVRQNRVMRNMLINIGLNISENCRILVVLRIPRHRDFRIPGIVYLSLSRRPSLC